MLMWTYAVLLNYIKICYNMYIVHGDKFKKNTSMRLNSTLSNTVKMFW